MTNNCKYKIGDVVSLPDYPRATIVGFCGFGNNRVAILEDGIKCWHNIPKDTPVIDKVDTFSKVLYIPNYDSCGELTRGILFEGARNVYNPKSHLFNSLSNITII